MGLEGREFDLDLREVLTPPLKKSVVTRIILGFRVNILRR